MRGKSQSIMILEYMGRGYGISPAEALVMCGSFRLAARIKDLRDKGHSIRTEIREDENGKRYARYHLQEA